MEKKISVMVVDDNPDFSRLMTIWLDSKGYATSIRSNGQEAIEAIKAKAPDVLFIDLKMPVMDGMETVKQIRTFNKDLPIIIISSHLDRVSPEDVEAYGISGVFFKGKDFEEGKILLESALRIHKKLKR